MSNLSNQYISSSFQSVMNVGTTNGASLTTDLQKITDGNGVSSALSLSTTQAAIAGTLTISGSILPDQSGSYDLGSSAKPFRHVYAGSGSYYLNGNRVMGLSDSNNLQLIAPNNEQQIVLNNNMVFAAANTGSMYGGAQLTYMGNGVSGSTNHVYDGQYHFFNTNGQLSYSNVLNPGTHPSGSYDNGGFDISYNLYKAGTFRLVDNTNPNYNGSPQVYYETYGNNPENPQTQFVWENSLLTALGSPMYMDISGSFNLTVDDTVHHAPGVNLGYENGNYAQYPTINAYVNPNYYTGGTYAGFNVVNVNNGLGISVASTNYYNEGSDLADVIFAGNNNVSGSTTLLYAPQNNANVNFTKDNNIFAGTLNVTNSLGTSLPVTSSVGNLAHHNVSAMVYPRLIVTGNTSLSQHSAQLFISDQVGETQIYHGNISMIDAEGGGASIGTVGGQPTVSVDGFGSYVESDDTSPSTSNYDGIGLTANAANSQSLTTTGPTLYMVNSNTGVYPILAGQTTDNFTNGAVTWYVPNAAQQGFVVAQLPGSQTIPNGADTIVEYTAEIDTNSWWNSGSHQFEPNVAGYYEINAFVDWAPNSSTTLQQNVQIRKNDSGLTITQSPITSLDNQTQFTSTIVYLNGNGDYVNVSAYTSATTSQNINGGNGSYITIKLL